jgi:hypothetical protein
VHRPAEPDLPADDAGVPAEALLPLLVRDDEHRGRALALVVVEDRPPHRRRHARHAEPRRGHVRDAHELRAAARQHERAAVGRVRAEVAQARRASAPESEVAERLALGVAGVPHVRVLDRDDALALVERERRVQDRGQEAEGARADGDGDGHADDRHDREPRVLREHAEREPEVEREAAEPGEAAAVAHLLLVALDAAEGDEGPAARLHRVEALPHQPRGLHLDVERHLLVHPRLGAASIEKETEAGTRGVEEAHGARAGGRRIPVGVGRRWAALL